MASGVVNSTRTSACERVRDHAEVLGRKPGEKHETKTTTEFADGRSVVTKEESQRSVGLDGVTHKSGKETEVRSAEGRVIECNPAAERQLMLSRPPASP